MLSTDCAIRENFFLVTDLELFVCSIFVGILLGTVGVTLYAYFSGRMSGTAPSKKLNFSGLECEDRATESCDKARQSTAEDSKSGQAANWCQQEAHLQRLKELRTGLLKHIQDTDWMYPPADKYIGKQ